MTSNSDRYYQNYFVFPFTDPTDPNWLSEFVLPETSNKLSEQEISVIAATLALTLPEPVRETNWRKTK